MVAPGKVLTFINPFCDIFDSLSPGNMKSPMMIVVPFFLPYWTVLLLGYNNTSQLFSVSFDGKVSDILTTS